MDSSPGLRLSSSGTLIGFESRSVVAPQRGSGATTGSHEFHSRDKTASDTNWAATGSTHTGAALSLEVDVLKIQLADALERGERDRQVLDREAGGVEDRDVVVALATRGLPGQNVSQLRYIFPREDTLLDRRFEVARLACLLPLVAEDVDTRELSHRDLRLAGPVSAHQARVLSGPQRTLSDDDLPAGRDRRDDVRGEGLVPGRGDRRAEFVCDGLGPSSVHVPEHDLAPDGAEGARDGASV